MRVSSPRYDLRSLFRAVGSFAGGDPASTTLERTEAAAEVSLIDAGCSEVTAEPVEVRGWVDGVQSRVVLRYFAHRPVSLAYVAAGAVDSAGALVHIDETLTLICAETDLDDVAELAATVGENPLPVRVVASTDPLEAQLLSAAVVDEMRNVAESDVVRHLCTAGVTPLVVDGDLRARRLEAKMIGVAKTHRTRYLSDESVLWGLPVGWRSPRFTIDAGGNRPRTSAYLRLHDASARAWDFGLVRVECWDPDLIDAACAAVFANRQPPGVTDSRWDRHLGPVAWCEQALRDHRPPEMRR